ncbi:AAA family ATPase [Actinocatenispora sera]|uniref:AAA+ ATPase domain-containing protein n=1 Tax=Actinocatenispora sera TaxID=390989 RepID=A0A810L031_9ACTN|nr:AAA family ATPase [Actinocatenispora sera]BCJ27608.1 hypothetical protein Asera_17160 [Actinocatenispora sera]
MPVGEFPLVGRDAARAWLDRARDAAAAGHGGLVVLTGEPGAGKTRLAREAVRGARAFRTVVVSCTGTEPLGPWTRTVRALTADDAEPAGVDRAFLRALRSGADLVLAADDDPGTAGRQLAEDVTTLVRRRAARRPLLLVFDDVSDADEPSLRLLTELALTVPELPVLVIATARPADVDWHGHLAARARLLRAGTAVPVEPLDGGAIAALLRYAGAADDHGRVAAVLARTAGNALFVTELLRAPRTDTLPMSVRALVDDRVAALPPAARPVVAAAAVLGTPIGTDVLAAVAPAEGFRGGLGAVLDAGLLTEAADGTVGFAHEIVRDAVYDGVPAADRAVLHARAGTVLADRGTDVAAAARHLARAGPAYRARAAELARQAGDRAAGRLGYADATGWYERALALSGDDTDRVSILLARAEARAAAGDPDGSRAGYLDAAVRARALRRPDLLAAAALGLGSGTAGFEVTMLDGTQLELLTEARAALPAATPLRALVTARLSVASSVLAGDAERSALAAEAVRDARASGDAGACAYALSARCDAHAGPDHRVARIADATAMLALAVQLGDPPLELLARRLRLVGYLEGGDVDAADAEALAFRTTAERLGRPLYLWYVPLWRGMRALMEGRTADCAALLADACALGDRAGSRNAAVLTRTQRWCLLAATGDRDGVAELGAGLDPDQFGTVWPYVTLALILAQTGRVDAARARLDAVAPRLPSAPRDSEWLPMLAQVAETVGVVGSHPVADPAYRALAGYAGMWVVEGIGAAVRGPVDRHLGLLAAARGDRAGAATHFAAAERACVDVGATLLAAEVCRDAGRALGDGGRLAAADRQYRALGLAAEGAGPDPVFRSDGEVWTLGYEGRQVRLRDAKGLRDLATLLARPGRPVAALDLATAYTRRPATGDAPGGVEGDLGEALDATARRAYRQRLAELEEELADPADPERAARQRAERDALVEQLTTAYGLGGRRRRPGSPTERARTAVTGRIRDAIRHIEAAHPPLGRHLRGAVHTGTFCVYEPEHPVRWQVTRRF